MGTTGGAGRQPGFVREAGERLQKAVGKEYFQFLKAEFTAARADGRSGAWAVYDAMHRDCPHLLGELAGLWRGGRDDLMNVLWGQALSAAPGAPGQPTQALITESLTHRDVDARNDVLGKGPPDGPDHTQQQSRGRSR